MSLLVHRIPLGVGCVRAADATRDALATGPVSAPRLAARGGGTLLEQGNDFRRRGNERVGRGRGDGLPALCLDGGDEGVERVDGGDVVMVAHIAEALAGGIQLRVQAVPDPVLEVQPLDLRDQGDDQCGGIGFQDAYLGTPRRSPEPAVGWTATD